MSQETWTAAQARKYFGGKRSPKGQPQGGRSRMNRTEQRFVDDLLSEDPALVHWQFEGVKISIGLPGQRCWYTPDFLVIDTNEARPVFFEVKGPYVREDARVKMLAAARIVSPWAGMRLAQWKNGRWNIEDLQNGGKAL